MIRQEEKIIILHQGEFRDHVNYAMKSLIRLGINLKSNHQEDAQYSLILPLNIWYQGGFNIGSSYGLWKIIGRSDLKRSNDI
jgi:hypothetical protein